MTDTTEKTPAQAAAQIIIDALHDARDNAVTEATIRAMDRAILVAMESGVLVTQSGAAVADLLNNLYRAMPAPGTNKLSAAWNAAAPAVYAPRYRIAGLDKPGAPIVVTDTATGRQRIWQPGEQADNVRGIYERTDSGAEPSRWGVGICGMHEELTVELMEKAED